MANRDKARDIHDERFCRMWECYLASCEVAFRHMSLMVFQVQVAKNRYTLPFTRDYMVDREREWASQAARPFRAPEKLTA